MLCIFPLHSFYTSLIHTNTHYCCLCAWAEVKEALCSWLTVNSSFPSCEIILLDSLSELGVLDLPGCPRDAPALTGLSSYPDLPSTNHSLSAHLLPCAGLVPLAASLKVTHLSAPVSQPVHSTITAWSRKELCDISSIQCSVTGKVMQ